MLISLLYSLFGLNLFTTLNAILSLRNKRKHEHKPMSKETLLTFSLKMHTSLLGVLSDHTVLLLTPTQRY